MNIKRFFAGFVLVFLFIFAFEWAFHGLYMRSIYQATTSLWRPEEDMQAYFPWMLGAQALLALVFTWVFTRGYENRGLLEGLRYGFYIALLLAAPHLIMFAVQPMPITLPIHWIVGSTIELMLAGALLSLIYKEN